MGGQVCGIIPGSASHYRLLENKRHTESSYDTETGGEALTNWVTNTNNAHFIGNLPACIRQSSQPQGQRIKACNRTQSQLVDRHPNFLYVSTIVVSEDRTERRS